MKEKRNSETCLQENGDRKNIRQENRKQREIIRQMDEKLILYREDEVMLQLAKWIYTGIVLLFLFLPGEMCVEEDWRGVAIMVVLWTAGIAPTGYLALYRSVKEQGKQVSYLKKIKYLPLDIRQVKLVRIGYLAQFLKKIVLIACAEQIVFGTLICGQNLFLGIAYAVIVGGVIPLVWNALFIWLER